MQEIQKLLNQKPYIKNLEIKKYFDYINNIWKINLLLTITEDEIYFDFPEEHDVTICFENINKLQIGDISGIVNHEFIVYDYAKNHYENQNRFQFAEEEYSALNFFFEKAEILS